MAVLRFDLDKALAQDIGHMARRASVTPAEILRQGLSVMAAYREPKKAGRNHIGFVSDPARLDVQMTGLLG